jgi:hypothetical protein
VNARKYAWQILQADIRRRVDLDEDKGLDLHPQLTNIAVLYKSAMEDGVSPFEIIIELAGFGATYALMPPQSAELKKLTPKVELMFVINLADDIDRDHVGRRAPTDAGPPRVRSPRGSGAGDVSRSTNRRNRIQGSRCSHSGHWNVAEPTVRIAASFVEMPLRIID